LVSSVLRREAQWSGQACQRMCRTVDGLQIGDNGGAVGIAVLRTRAGRGARSGDGDARCVIALRRLPTPTRIVSVARTEARREGQRIGVGTVEDQRRERV
jgi:hypothetical protein